MIQRLLQTTIDGLAIAHWLAQSTGNIIEPLWYSNPRVHICKSEFPSSMHRRQFKMINTMIRMEAFRRVFYFYASERSIFSFVAAAASSEGGSLVSSVSDGWDSCFAAACNTLLWTSDDEGIVGNPLRFVSSFPAAHEIAWPPSLTGTSSSLGKKRREDKTLFTNLCCSIQILTGKAAV